MHPRCTWDESRKADNISLLLFCSTVLVNPRHNGESRVVFNANLHALLPNELGIPSAFHARLFHNERRDEPMHIYSSYACRSLLLIVAIVISFTQPAFGIGMRHDLVGVSSSYASNPYVTLGTAYDSVAQLSWTTFRGDFQATATLVHSTVAGEYKILTAAHVVDGSAGSGTPDRNIDASEFVVSFGDDANSPTHQITVASENIAVHPRWAAGDPFGTQLGPGAAQFDLAVLTFSEADVTTGSIDTLPQGYQLTSTSPIGEVGTLVGYGRSGLGDTFASNNDGIRRAGENFIDTLDTFSAEENDGLTIRTDFDAFDFPIDRSVSGMNGPAQYLEASTALGDSGSPLLVGNEIVGVLHGGYNHFLGADQSEYGDVSVWAPISEPLNMEFLHLNGLAFYAQAFASSSGVVAVVPEPTGNLSMLAACVALPFTRRRRSSRR